MSELQPKRESKVDQEPTARFKYVGTNPGTDEIALDRVIRGRRVLPQIERRECNSAKQGSAQTFRRQECDSAPIVHFKANTTYSACQLLDDRDRR
jgi:hypothetical protein